MHGVGHAQPQQGQARPLCLWLLGGRRGLLWLWCGVARVLVALAAASASASALQWGSMWQQQRMVGAWSGHYQQL